MARLSKLALLNEVEKGLQAGGWSVLFLTAPSDHPARYRINENGISTTIRVYIWNISHGGGRRSASEYRIQITGLDPRRFVQEPNGKTIILGYWDNEEVFAGFDINHHLGVLGGSPSLQIGEDALLNAKRYKFSVHEKGNGELAIAFTPDFIGTYINNLDSLHGTGGIPAEVRLLNRIATDPSGVPEPEISTTASGGRQYAISQTRRALRALDFKDRVLKAYQHRCAMCGIQLRLVDGAHILPVSEPHSTDETANGIALCALHHRAYDRGLITFDRRYKVHVNTRQVADLQVSARDGKLAEFERALSAIIHLPPAAGDRPNPDYVGEANTLRGWSLC